MKQQTQSPNPLVLPLRGPRHLQKGPAYGIQSYPTFPSKKSRLMLKGRVRSFCGPDNCSKSEIRKQGLFRLGQRSNTAKKPREKNRRSTDFENWQLRSGDEGASDDSDEPGSKNAPIREFNKLMSSVNVLSQQEEWGLQDSLESLSHSSRLDEQPAATQVLEDFQIAPRKEQKHETQSISSDTQNQQARHFQGLKGQTNEIKAAFRDLFSGLGKHCTQRHESPRRYNKIDQFLQQNLIMAGEYINRGDCLQKEDQQNPLEVETRDDIFKSFSLRFDALTERIEALEAQVSELKKQEKHCFSQILKKVEMVDKGSMAGEPLLLSILPTNTKLMSLGEILSLETKDCFSAGLAEGDSRNSLVQWRVKQELNSIYEISLNNVSKGKLSDTLSKYPSPTSQEGDMNQVLNTKHECNCFDKNSRHELAMVPKRSSPASKRRPHKEEAQAQVFGQHHLFSHNLDSKGSQQNLFNFFSRSQNTNQLIDEVKPQSTYSNSCSQQDVKIDQNIDLDFNLVENYDLENNNSINSESKTSGSVLSDREYCIKDNLKIHLIDMNAINHNHISETTNSANYGRHSFTFKERPFFKSIQQNDSPDDEKYNYEGTNLQTSSSNYFDMVDQGKLSHEYDCPQQRNSFQLLVSPRGLNTMTVGNQIGPAFTDRPHPSIKQTLYQYDDRSAGVMQFDQSRLKYMMDQLSPEKQTSGDAFIDMDLQRPRANSSPQNFLFSPNKPLNKRSHEYTSDNLDMIIQEEEFSNTEVTDEIQQPKLESQIPSLKRFLSRNTQQATLAPNIAWNEIKEESPQFIKEWNEPESKKINTNQLYNVSKSPLIQPSFKQMGRFDELESKKIPLNLNQGHHPSFGQASFQPFQANFQMPQGMNLQEAFSHPRFRYSDFPQAQQEPKNYNQIGISQLPPSEVRVESVESQTQTTPQKMSFGVPPSDDQDLGQNKFFHSVDKQFQMDQLQWPSAFEPTANLQPGRPQSVPVCFQQFEQIGQAPKRQPVVDFKVNKFQLDSDRQLQPQQNYLINQQMQPFSNNTNQIYKQMNQLSLDMNQRTNTTHQFYEEVQRLNSLLPISNLLTNQNYETASGAEAKRQTQLQPPLPLLAPLGRSKTLVKKTEHSSGIVDKTTQPTELTDRLNQNAQVVNFIRITKHQPTRKNMKQQLIFCQNEIREDYKFSKYLEQNRYSRLFNEKELLGEGGFGKVYKVEHVLDQRMYAIKQIQIHLGINEDFKKHSVYREIVAISQVQHKNVVRYHACWIESMAPDMKEVNKAVRKLEQSMKQKLKDGKNKKKDESNSEESKLDIDESLINSYMMTKSLKNGNRFSEAKKKDQNKGQNMLSRFNQESEMHLNEDWAFSREILNTEKSEQSKEIQKKVQKDSDSSSSSANSSNSSSSSSNSEDSSSCSEEKSFEQNSDFDSESNSQEQGSDEETSVDSSGSLYQLIDKEKDFITLNVMIQMEHCIGNTLREFLDNKDYIVNRKMVFHFFKQLINGLKHIHEEGLIHRDIKPANIFIDNARMQLKIGDFGLAKKQNNMKQQLEQEIQGLKRTNLSLANLHQCNSINTIQAKEHLEKKYHKATQRGYNQASADQQAINVDGENHDTVQSCNNKANDSICAGTPMYQAPEQTMHQIQIAKKANETVCLTDKVDMFAAGLLLYELCFNFRTQHQRIQKFHQLRTQRKLPDEIFKNMPEEKDIILNLTDPDPKKRSSAHYLVNSKTFQSWSFEVKQ